jgi:hypothetical protein
VRAAGQVRRSQVISTYGIGAIVDLETGSFMPLGLEDWETQLRGGRQASIVIYEPRLQAQLNVEHFRLPPIVEDIPSQPGFVELRYSVPAVRFPRWHECPACHRLGTEGDPFALHPDGNQLVCNRCNGKRVNPVRFVVACGRGHIDDFPWEAWAHRDREDGRCQNPVLYLQSRGESAALADLYVSCKTCRSGKSLADVFGKEALRGHKCRGRRPWLIDREDCTQEGPPRVLQRGASNIHFTLLGSMLSIPPVSEPIFQALDEHWSVLRSLPREALVPALSGIADRYGVSAESLVAAFDQRLMIERGTAGYSETASRAEEYLALGSSRDDPPVAGHIGEFQNEVADAPRELAAWFDLVGAVSRLREVRAMAGFTRIEPYPGGVDRIADAIAKGEVAPLSKTPRQWLPAAEIRGEGIFLRFRTGRIDKWIADNPELGLRAARLDAIAARIAAERGYRRQYPITPRLLLVHAFAHAMIRQLSIDCGYSSSALRERLYVAEPENGQSAMNGLLIYTGSPDSEGSLGGLVRLAAPPLIADAVVRAIRTARWCGSDPVCLESDPDQSGERLSGAACHCCLLVPETACEKYNRELDRTMLVGDADGRWRGFFSDLPETLAG